MEMNTMTCFICPICGEPLHKTQRSMMCCNRHVFDIARQGYVNLLPVQNKKSLNPGDTKEMLVARRKFLESGTYRFLCDTVTEKVIALLTDTTHPLIVDMGCGEGYYTLHIKNALHDCQCVGIDISKDAVKMACNRDKSIHWTVATAGHIPLADSSTDMITALFSLVAEKEYLRILKQGGYVVEVIAGNQHLTELKAIIYDEVYEQHKKPTDFGDAFTEIGREEKTFRFTLENEQLNNLLLMTPHFWRIKRENREKLQTVSQMTLTAHFWIRVLQKK